MEPASRKLAAILCADVAGYSRLMADDHDATLATLTAYREVFSRNVTQHQGRVVNSPGDAVLAEFGSVVDAVACAAEIQRELGERNAELPSHRKMEFRIGVNLGDVLVKDSDLFGDGVNIAARLQALADPGGICISGSAFDQVEGRLPLEYADMGEQSVKNIPKPVRAYKVLSRPGAAAHRVVRARRVLARHWRRWVIGGTVAAALIVISAAGTWRWLHRGAPPGTMLATDGAALPLPDEPSIAVLPFVNMSDDPEQEYFADGISEDIITDLSKLRGLFVVARNSSFAYKGVAVDVREIGRKLGVRYVLEGGVRRAGEQLRINAQLIDATTGNHLWAERFDRQVKDLFSVQDEITRRIVTELDVQLVEGEQARVWRRSTNSAEAYDLFLRGKRFQDQFSQEGMSAAIPLLKRAIELDPNFATAIWQLGVVHYLLVASSWSDSPEESWITARELFKRAIALDDGLGEAHAFLALVHLAEREYEQALSRTQRALAVSPGGAFVHAQASIVASYAGDPLEGLRLIKKAWRLDPNPDPLYYFPLGAAHLFLGNHREAVEAYEECLRRLADSFFCNLNAVVAYMQAGKLQEARARAEHVLRLNPGFNSVTTVLVRRIKDEAIQERWKQLLREAGLP